MHTFLRIIIIVSAIIILKVNTKSRQPLKYLSKTEIVALKFANKRYMHAESPVWDADAGTLYWVDVLEQEVHALHYDTMRHRVKHIEYGEVNVVVPVANSSRVLVCVRSEVFLLDWDRPGESALRLVAAFHVGKPDNILNEGKADALGRFWIGSKGPQSGDDVRPNEGALYSLEAPCFVPQSQLKPVSVSNGLTWALNNTVFYYNDSGTRKIEAFDFNLDRGSLDNRRTIVDISEYGYDLAIPDGMTIDKDGHLWVALMFEGTIIHIDPDARVIVEKYELPVSRTTSLSWAGPGLDMLVVTTSRRNMDREELVREPLSGSMFFITDLGTSGVPDHKFVFNGADYY